MEMVSYYCNGATDGTATRIVKHSATTGYATKTPDMNDTAKCELLTLHYNLF